MDEHCTEEAILHEASVDTVAAAETLPPGKKRLTQDDPMNEHHESSTGLDRMRRTIEEWIQKMNNDDERVFLGEDLTGLLANRQTEFSAFKEIYTSLRSLMEHEEEEDGNDGDDDDDTVGTAETDEELHDRNELDSYDEVELPISDNLVVETAASPRQQRIDKRYEQHLHAKEHRKARSAPTEIIVWHLQVEEEEDCLHFKLREAGNAASLELYEDEILAHVHELIEESKSRSDVVFKIFKDSDKYEVDHVHIVGHLEEMLSHQESAAAQVVTADDSKTRWKNKVRRWWKLKRTKESLVQPMRAIKGRTASWKARMMP